MDALERGVVPCHPRHSCAPFTHQGHTVRCAPPWHFFGWYAVEEDIPPMRRAAQASRVRLRCGEMAYRDPVTQRAYSDVWLHEGVTPAHMGQFWQAVHTLKEAPHATP